MRSPGFAAAPEVDLSELGTLDLPPKAPANEAEPTEEEDDRVNTTVQGTARPGWMDDDSDEDDDDEADEYDDDGRLIVR